MQIVRRAPDKGYVDTWLWIPRARINADGVKAALTCTFFERGKAQCLTLWRETETHLLVPREFWDVSEFDFPIVDCRPRSYPQVTVRSRITLDAKKPDETTQRDAVEALMRCRGGILVLACGKGKTVIALEVIARSCVPTIIAVDNTQLLEQWQGQIRALLEVPGGVGLIQQKTFAWKHSIVLTTFDTLAARAAVLPEEVRRWFGMIIWDEGHHLAAPTWAQMADLFPGKRIMLTATPERADGQHVIYDAHVGKPVYRDLRQHIQPRFYFLWTGLRPCFEDVHVRRAVCDRNGDVHLSKLTSYFAGWRERLEFIVKEIRAARAQGRRILVVSKSIAELVNLLAIWNGRHDLYSDIAEPTPEDVGERLPPVHLSHEQLEELHRAKVIIDARLADRHLDPLQCSNLQRTAEAIRIRFKQHEIYMLQRKALRERQRDYIRQLLAMPSDAGLMIYEVPAKARMAMLRSKPVMFIISKYGREGLDEDRVDTIIACSAMSDENGLQQLMGRTQRERAGKKAPVVVFLEDDVPVLSAMCRKLRKSLLSWPADKGGPYEYRNLGHPQLMRSQNRSNRWIRGSSIGAIEP